MDTTGTKVLMPKEQIKLMKVASILTDMGLLGVYNKLINRSLMMVYQKNAISVIVILLHSGEVYRRNIKRK
jgi:hypothetical protein